MSESSSSSRWSPRASLNSLRFLTVCARCHCADSHCSRVTSRYPASRVQSGSTNGRSSGYRKGCVEAWAWGSRWLGRTLDGCGWNSTVISVTPLEVRRAAGERSSRGRMESAGTPHGTRQTSGEHQGKPKDLRYPLGLATPAAAEVLAVAPRPALVPDLRALLREAGLHR